MSDYINLNGQDFSFFGPGSRLRGEFHLQGISHIAAKLNGQLTITDDSPITIERDGEIEGTITCNDIEVFGSIEGTISSTGTVIIHPPGVVEGKITAKNLVIYPGSRVNMEAHTISTETSYN